MYQTVVKCGGAVGFGQFQRLRRMFRVKKQQMLRKLGRGGQQFAVRI